MRAIAIIAGGVFRDSIRDRIGYGLVFFSIMLMASSFLLAQLTAGQDVKIIKDLGLASASAIISSDFNPDNPNPKDLEVFRERVMALRSTLGIHQDMATRLVKNYAEALAQ